VLTRTTSLVFVITLVLAQFSPLRAQSPRPNELTDLRIAKAERTVVEGKSGIQITFDTASAERVRQFTSGAVGSRVIVFFNKRRLASLRVLDPITDGNILLTGELGSDASEALPSATDLLSLEIDPSETGK
jgi:hypothetical protein